MDWGDCLRVAIFVLFLLLVYRQVQEPEIFNQRMEFTQMVYASNEAQQRAVLSQLQFGTVHVYMKKCRDVIVPVCKEILEIPTVRPSITIFCEEMWGYCNRYTIYP